MSCQWTETKIAIEEFFKILACGKCKKTTHRPMRLITCGHMFCETCCETMGSICLICKMPFSPNEIQLHHTIAQLIKNCTIIEEAINEKTCDDNSYEAKVAPQAVANMFTALERATGSDEKDLEPGTPGYRGPTQDSETRNRNKVHLNDPDYMEQSQINTSLKGIELESETPGFRSPTQTNTSFKQDNAATEPETLGYRDPTQMVENRSSNDSEEKSYRKMCFNLSRLDDRRIKEIIGVPENDDLVESTILAPESLQHQDYPDILDHEENNAIPESIDTVVQVDTVSVNNLESGWTRELEEDNIPIRTKSNSSSGNSLNLTVEILSCLEKSVHCNTDDVLVEDSPVDLDRFNIETEQVNEIQSVEKTDLAEIHATNTNAIESPRLSAFEVSRNGRVIVKKKVAKSNDNLNEISGNKTANDREPTILTSTHHTIESERSKSDRREINYPVAGHSRENFKVSIAKVDRSANAKKPVILKDHNTVKSNLSNADSKESFSESLNKKKTTKKNTKTEIAQFQRKVKPIDKTAIPKTIPKNVHKRNAKGETLLHTACVKGQEEYVKLLLKNGANPNAKDNAGWTALQEAVTLAHSNICKILLESGASPNTPGMDNKTALHDAAINDRLEEAALLLKFNASRDVFDKYGHRPMDYVRSPAMRELLTDDSDIVENLEPGDHSILIPNAKVVVLPLNLSNNNKKMLMQMAPKIKVAVATAFRPGVTHVVVETNERNIAELTYDVMLAILEGKWIINSQWISISSDVNDISDLELEIFQVRGAPNLGTPERARANEEAQKPRLFNNCSFYFTIGVRSSWTYGKLELTKQLLSNLVVAGQGAILNREPNPEDVEDIRVTPFHVAHNPRHPLHKCSYYIIYMPGKEAPRIKYNMPHMKTLPLAWFFECIEKFELVDPYHMGIS